MAVTEDRPNGDDRFEMAKQLFFEGLAHYEAGRMPDAENCFELALTYVPGRVSTLVNLASTRLKLGKPQQALAAADEVLASAPDTPDAWLHRGDALAALGRRDDALHAYERLVALAAQSPLAWFNHAHALQLANRHAEAAESYRRATTLDPTFAAAWSNLGNIHRVEGRLDDATHAFRQALAHGADAELTNYYLAAVAAARDTTAEAAPNAYVEALFDDYADEFEHHLVDVLGYRGHIELVSSVSRLRRPGRFVAALDLGCGTGLCGPLLRPACDRLVGIDLSERMLEKARSRGCYDELMHADLMSYLAAVQERFDLAVAADVLIYFGDLAPLFAQIKRVLNPGGLFCFSVESANASEGFALLPTLRYEHSERYLRETATAQQFEIVEVTAKPIRQDQRQSVDGLFVYLRA